MEAPMNRGLIPLMFPGSNILQSCLCSPRWKVAISSDEVAEAWHEPVLDPWMGCWPDSRNLPILKDMPDGLRGIVQTDNVKIQY